MSSFSIEPTEPTDESGSSQAANSISTKASSRRRIAKRSEEPQRSSITSAGSSKPDPAVKEWIHYERGPLGPQEIAPESWSIRDYSDDRSTEAKTASNSVLGDTDFKFVYWYPDNNTKIVLSTAEPSQTSDESSSQSKEIGLTGQSSIMSDVTAWITQSARRDPPVTLPVTGLFDLLGSEESQMDAALFPQGSAENGWLDFVKTMRSMKFCPGEHSACSHINRIPLGDRNIPVSINRASAIRGHPLISLLFTVRVKDGVNQGSALYESLFQSKQHQLDIQALEGLTAESRYTVDGLVGIKPAAFEYVKVFMNEDKTAGWWIGRTQFHKDASEETDTYYGLRVDDGRDIEPSAGRG